MFFRQLFDAPSCTYTYVIADKTSGQAVIFDSVLEQFERDMDLLKQWGFTLIYNLETHIHADHITAASKLKAATHCQLAYPETAEVSCPDRLLKDGDVINFGNVSIKTLATPGHTNCSCCYLINDKLLLTGDTLLIRGCGRTDFQEGDAGKLYDNIHQKIFTLDDDILVYPAHDYFGITCSTVGEEKRFNPRLANTTREAFIKLMAELNLPKPKHMDKAVPANLHCGKKH